MESIAAKEAHQRHQPTQEQRDRDMLLDMRRHFLALAALTDADPRDRRRHYIGIATAIGRRFGVDSEEARPAAPRS